MDAWAEVPNLSPPGHALPTMLKFILMVNKQGQTRLAEYCEFMSIEERVALEAEIIRKCLSRTEMQVRRRAAEREGNVVVFSLVLSLCSWDCRPALVCNRGSALRLPIALTGSACMCSVHLWSIGG